MAGCVCSLVVLSGCGGGPDAPEPGTEALPTASSGAASSAEEQPAGPVAGNDAADADDGRSAVPVVLSQRCASPLGFEIAYPEGWSVNSGDTVPPCTRFAPAAFDVSPGTDARAGAVSASVRTATFEQVVGTQAYRAVDRTRTTVDGRRAVRIERESEGEGLYPAGIRSTSYVIELDPGDDGAQALVVDTVGLPAFDYEDNVQVLDLMIGTMEFGSG